MAKVWMVHGTQQRDSPTMQPRLRCIKLLEVDEYCRTEDRPKFGEGDTGFFPSTVVVQLEADEAREHGIAPGFFVSPVAPDDAEARLGDYLR